MFGTMWAYRTCRCIIQLSSDCWMLSGNIAVGCGLRARKGVDTLVSTSPVFLLTYCMVVVRCLDILFYGIFEKKEKRRQLYFLTFVFNKIVPMFVVNIFISYRYEIFASFFLTFSSNDVLMFYCSSILFVLNFLINSVNLESFVTPLNARLFVHIVSWGHGMG